MEQEKTNYDINVLATDFLKMIYNFSSDDEGKLLKTVETLMEYVDGLNNYHQLETFEKRINSIVIHLENPLPCVKESIECLLQHIKKTKQMLENIDQFDAAMREVRQKTQKHYTNMRY